MGSPAGKLQSTCYTGHDYIKVYEQCENIRHYERKLTYIGTYISKFYLEERLIVYKLHDFNNTNCKF